MAGTRIQMDPLSEIEETDLNLWWCTTNVICSTKWKKGKLKNLAINNIGP